MEFLATPLAHDILELCELRNMILMNIIPHHCVFINPKQIAHVPTAAYQYASSQGFYSEHGKPNYALIGSKVLAFWPDEWRAMLGEAKAVGHYVQYYTVESQWVEGKVTAYDKKLNTYLLEVKGLWNVETEQFAEVGSELKVYADLESRPHHWSDISNQQSILGKGSKLKYQSSDVSKFIRVWWSRYQRFYYGRVVAYDNMSKQHTIMYEDNDSRSYDMNTKEYELIDPPMDLLKGANGMSDSHAAKLIADWHRSESHGPSAESADLTQTDAKKDAVVTRPLASAVVSLSHYQVDNIDAYISCGGVENMITCCTDQSLSPPSCRMLLLYLQLIYNLRQYIGPKKFRDYTWDLKEVLPLALLRYDDEQIREFNLKDFNDVLISLRDLLNIAAARRHQLLNPKTGAQSGAGRGGSAYHQSSLMYNKISISPAKFDKWLEQSNIVDMLFGENIHQETISKADSILVYMSSRKMLHEQHLATIWQASKGKHEAIVRVNYHLLLVITPALDTQLKAYLFNLMSSTPAQEYNEHILRLIQAFTIESLRSAREDKREDFLFVDGSSNTGDERVLSVSSGINRKGQVVNAPEKQWMGFGLLWQYVLTSSEENSNIDPNLSSLAVELLVELLAEEFAEERDMVMQRCIDNIQVGVSVPISLTLLRSILSLYPASNKSWFILARQSVGKTMTISQQIEKLVKQNKLMDVVFGELERYHNQATNSATVVEAQGRVKSMKGGKSVDNNRLRGVVDRLDFLQFVLSKSCIKLTEAQALIIWKVFGEDTSSEEALDKLCYWLDGLVTSEHPQLLAVLASFVQENDVLYPDLASRFSFLGDIEGKSFEISKRDAESNLAVLEDNVVSKVFHECLLTYAFEKDSNRTISRPAFASLAIKMFFVVNMNSKAVRMENENGSHWQRVGNLEGIQLIWRLAVDADNEDVALCAMKILVELNQRNMVKNKVQDHVKANFLKLCFKQKYLIMQSLSTADAHDALSDHYNEIQGRVSKHDNVNKQDEWFEDSMGPLPPYVQQRRIARLSVLVQMFVHRFYYVPNYFVNVRAITGSDENGGIRFTFKSTDTVGSIRQRIGVYFKEEASAIIIQTSASSSAADKLEKDDVSLFQAKLAFFEKLFVKKKDSEVISNASNTNNTASNSVPSTESIANTDLDKEFSDYLDPLDWMSVSPNNNTLFALPKLPFQSSVLLSLTEGNQTVVAGVQPLLEGVVISSERYELLTECLVPLIKTNPFYIDQLLETLDGYLATRGDENSHVVSVLWDTIQSLPFQSHLYGEIRSVIQEGDSNELRLLLNLHSPYRMLYTLQILDAAFNPVPKYARVQLLSSPHKWSSDVLSKFFAMGGVEYIVSQLHVLLDRLSDASALPTDTASLYLHLVSLILRVLQYCLVLDPLYRVWRVDASKFGKQASDNTPSTKDDSIAPGIVLAHMDASRLITAVLSITDALSVTMAFIPTGLVNAFNAFMEHALDMVLSLAIAREDGHNLLASSDIVVKLVASSVVCPLPGSVTQAIARRFFEACAVVFIKCADPLLLQEVKPMRMTLYDFCINSIINAAVKVEKDIRQGDSQFDRGQQFESLYSLIAAVECMRISPEVTFKCMMPFSTKQAVPGQNAAIFQDVLASREGVNSKVASTHDRKNLIRMFVEKLWQQESQETFHSSQVDGLLIGILRALLVFAHEEKEYMGGLRDESNQGEFDNFIDFLVGKCLLPRSDVYGKRSNSYTAALCQTPQTRAIGYALLYTLCERSEENFSLATIAMLKHHPLPSQILLDHQSAPDTNIEHADHSLARYYNYYKKRSWQWDYDPNLILRSSGDYIGLCNQGGTCYMNAFIQQLYHAQTFTDQLLSVSTYAEEAEYSHLLLQMQMMFAYLKYSQKRVYDTLPFCKALIDYDGQPISLSEQKDINEFAGMLFDKLEKNSAAAELLAQTIQGTYIWQTKSLETTYYSEREEKFYMITVEVKNKKTLLEALELTVAEELFTGENKIEDSENNKKVDAVRRCAIRDLPPVLIIHLKRFEFDLETMNRKKVNDYMSFPFELDMFPYTEEALASHTPQKPAVPDASPNDQKEDEAPRTDNSSQNTVKRERDQMPPHYYQYSLQGIVAHVGAIDRGHYYSFIKDRKPRDNSSSEDVWYEFNDRMVLPFSPDQIPKECFGGSDEITNASGQTITRARENNAYLLIYERKEQVVKPTPNIANSFGRLSPLPSTIGLSNMLPEPTQLSRQSTQDEDTNMSMSKTLTAKPKMSRRVEEAIRSENTEFQQDRFLFHKHHSLFFWKMLLVCESLVGKYHNNEGSVENRGVTQYWILVTLHYLIDVLGRSKVHSTCSVFYDKIEGILQLDPQIAWCLVQELGSKCSNYFKMHIWNRVMYIDCPHNHLIKRYSRVLKLAAKLCRDIYCTHPLLPVKNRPMDASQNNPQSTMDSMHRQIQDALSVYIQQGDNANTYIMLMMHNLFVTIESVLPEDIARKDGEYY
ncbi:hypothetical protein EON65_26000 [archaeon]|nr:MAG: hypothetical protein EON65_26000 [archaeon]